MKICFIVSSCIYTDTNPNFRGNGSEKRSAFSWEERVLQTYKTIESIREKIDNAYIILVDNGDCDPKDYFDTKVDKYVYIGDKRFARKAALKNKSFGEAVLMLYALPFAKEYDFIFKLSGRYYLNDKFDLMKWDLNKICFLHNTEKFKN